MVDVTGGANWCGKREETKRKSGSALAPAVGAMICIKTTPTAAVAATVRAHRGPVARRSCRYRCNASHASTDCRCPSRVS